MVRCGVFGDGCLSAGRHGVGVCCPHEFLHWGHGATEMTDPAVSVSRVTLEATIVRADGTRRELGVIASSDPGEPGVIERGSPGERRTEKE